MGLEEIHFCSLRLIIIYSVSDVEDLSEDKLQMQLPQNNVGQKQNRTQKKRKTKVFINPLEATVEVTFLYHSVKF